MLFRSGGDQERGLRSGTVYPPQIVGFGKAVELAIAEMSDESKRLGELRDLLLSGLLRELGSTRCLVNGTMEHRLSKNLNISIPEIDPSTLTLALGKSIALSSGSACATKSRKPSHVLEAIGRSAELAFSSLRFGLGRGTTAIEIDRAIEIIAIAVRSQA